MIENGGFVVAIKMLVPASVEVKVRVFQVGAEGVGGD